MNNKITSWVTIRNNGIRKNDEPVMNLDASSLDSFLIDAYRGLKIDYPKFYKMDNLSKLGFLAAEVLLQGSGVENYPGTSVACVMSNKYASLDTDIRYFETAKAAAASPALFVYTLPNIVTGEICIRHKIKGENAFFVSERFDVTDMVDYVEMLFHSNRETKACLAGWVDCWKDHHDVFLYLVEKEAPSGYDHDPASAELLYTK